MLCLGFTSTVYAADAEKHLWKCSRDSGNRSLTEKQWLEHDRFGVCPEDSPEMRQAKLDYWNEKYGFVEDEPTIAHMMKRMKVNSKENGERWLIDTMMYGKACVGAAGMSAASYGLRRERMRKLKERIAHRSRRYRIARHTAEHIMRAFLPNFFAAYTRAGVTICAFYVSPDGATKVLRTLHSSIASSDTVESISSILGINNARKIYQGIQEGKDPLELLEENLDDFLDAIAAESIYDGSLDFFNEAPVEVFK